MYKSIDQKLAAADVEFQAMTIAYKDTSAQLVFLRDEIFRVADSFEISTLRTVHCAGVGHHPKNRPLTVARVPQKVTGFTLTGFSPEECKRACVVGRIPGDVGNAYEGACTQTAKDSQGQLAEVVAGSLTEFTLTCNHTFQALRCVYFGTASDEEGITKDGRFSKPLVQAKSKSLMQAVETGVAHVRCFPYQFELKYPELVECIIEADNIPLQSAEKDTTVDRLVKCHKHALNNRLEDGTPDWKRIELLMKRSEPDRAHDVASIIGWMKSSCGGVEDPWIMNDIVRFQRSLKVYRDIPPNVLGGFEKVNLGVTSCPYWRAGVAKAILLARPSDMVNGVNTYMSCSDVAGHAKNSIKFIETANAYMQRARELALDKSLKKLPKAEIDLILDTFDIRLVGHILKRPLKGTFTSMMSIGTALHASFVEAAFLNNLKYKVECPADWKAAGTVFVAASSAARVATLSKTTATKETVTAFLKDAGYKMNEVVRERASQRACTITDITDTEVVLRDIAKGDKARDEKFLVTEFRKLFVCDVVTKKDRARNTIHEYSNSLTYRIMNIQFINVTNIQFIYRTYCHARTRTVARGTDR